MVTGSAGPGIAAAIGPAHDEDAESGSMNRFARLADDLLFSPSPATRLRLLVDYFVRTPDPDRGYALAALTGGLDLKCTKPAVIRALVETRIDPALFAASHDFVGDLAETAALIWPARGADANAPAPRLGEIVAALDRVSPAALPPLLERWFDRLDATGRWALIKLVTGGLRAGIPARLAKEALAAMGRVDVAKLDEIWHGLAPPYAGLFAWLEGRGPIPVVDHASTFRPMMFARSLDQSDLSTMKAGDFRAAWQWDGLRVQIVARGGTRRIFSHTGNDISDAFPDILQALDFDAVLDGELLVRRGDAVAPFGDLQQRLDRKRVTGTMLAAYPAFVRLHDILFEGTEDLRPLPFDARRVRLERWHASIRAPRLDVSSLISFASWHDLRAIRANADVCGAKGVMLKHSASPYVAGQPGGMWFAWKHDIGTVDAVLVYAQRGHGRHASPYSDFTFACWRDAVDGGQELVPVGKAGSGITGAELARLDKWVRDHTTERFGPVRAVAPRLVCALAFDGVRRSARHKSGLVLRSPQIHRVRWEKKAAEADRIATLAAMLDA